MDTNSLKEAIINDMALITAARAIREVSEALVSKIDMSEIVKNPIARALMSDTDLQDIVDKARTTLSNVEQSIVQVMSPPGKDCYTVVIAKDEIDNLLNQ